MGDGNILAIGIGITVGILLNFVPTAIAYGRQHPERRLIGRLNILAVVSFLLWLALLAWAVGGKRDDSVIGRFVGNEGQRGRLLAVVGILVALGLGMTGYALLKA